MTVHHSGGGKAPFGAGAPDATRRMRDLPRLLRIALRLLWEADRKTLVFGAVLQIVAGLGFAVQLLVANQLLRQLLKPGVDRGDLPTLVGLLVLSGAILAGLSFAATAQAGVRKLLGERVVRHVQRLILDTAASVDVIDFEDATFYDRLQRAQQQGVPTPLMISGSLLEASAGAVGVVAIGIALLVINPLLVPLVFLGAVPAWLATSKASQELYSFSYGNTPNDRMRGALTEVVTRRGNADEVRAFDLYGYVREQWERLYAERIDKAATMVRGQLVRLGLASALSAVAQTGVFALLAYLFVTDRIDLAAAATAAFAAQQLGSRLLALAGSAAVIYENVLYLDDFDGFVRLRDSEKDRAPGLPTPATFERLTGRGLSFTYPNTDTPALREVDVEIRAGEVVALVGENGSGKTTLAKVLTGLYRPQDGQVLWDGTDISELDATTFRQRVAVIFQDFVRYPFNVADNVGIGDVARLNDRAAIAAAAAAAGATEIIENLPQGLETVLGKQFDGGTDLSVGQWQRIALARAFFRSAPLLVLDEPTAALDPRAERALFDSMRDLSRGRTVLMISHRFSSVRAADRILVLENGRVTEQGSHHELMALGGQYAELFNLQASAYLGDDGDTTGLTPTAVTT